MILESAGGADAFEGGDSHDEVIDKLLRNGHEAAVDVVVAQLVDYKVFLGGLDIIGVENDLAEVQVSDKHMMV